jgi:hypothetical protein
MDLKHVKYLIAEKSSTECSVMCRKGRKMYCKQIVFWLPYKILLQYNYTNCQQLYKLQTKQKLQR